MKRRLILSLLLLMGGALFNVAVAWCFSWMTTATATPGSAPLWVFREEDMTAVETAVLSHFESIGFAPTPIERCYVFHLYPVQFVNLGRQICYWTEQMSVRSGADCMHQGFVLSRRAVQQHSAGWPMMSMTGEMYNRATMMERATSIDENWRSHAAIILPSRRLSFGMRDQLLPLWPIWPGFAINTVFYAVIHWLLFAGPFALRRRLRLKRGLCPKCAYPVGSWGSPVCTECGAPHVVVTHRH